MLGEMQMTVTLKVQLLHPHWQSKGLCCQIPVALEAVV